jgi:hypothetical protein
MRVVDKLLPTVTAMNRNPTRVAAAAPVIIKKKLSQPWSIGKQFSPFSLAAKRTLILAVEGKTADGLDRQIDTPRLLFFAHFSDEHLHPKAPILLQAHHCSFYVVLLQVIDDRVVLSNRFWKESSIGHVNHLVTPYAKTQ